MPGKSRSSASSLSRFWESRSSTAARSPACSAKARAVARLDHPGIATVYYVGQDADTCYMAMELVEGVPLDRMVQAVAALDEPGMTIESVLERLPIEEGSAKALRFDLPGDYPDSELEAGPAKSSANARSAHALQLLASRDYVKRCCEMICDAAEALAHAHEQGVVHRDLKPANLIIDRECRGHLVDFGIARFFDDTTVTRTGALVGTPMYLAPELLTGSVRADHLSDIYSLGLVFYELLTLERPIEATTREGILREVISKQLKPVSWLNPAVPRDLEGVVHKAVPRTLTSAIGRPATSPWSSSDSSREGRWRLPHIVTGWMSARLPPSVPRTSLPSSSYFSSSRSFRSSCGGLRRCRASRGSTPIGFIRMQPSSRPFWRAARRCTGSVRSVFRTVGRLASCPLDLLDRIRSQCFLCVFSVLQLRARLPRQGVLGGNPVRAHAHAERPDLGRRGRPLTAAELGIGSVSPRSSARSTRGIWRDSRSWRPRSRAKSKKAQSLEE